MARDAWVVDDAVFVKEASASPGVARQYSGTLGKVGNCQVAVSICAVTDGASCPLNWRLFLPAGWDDTAASTPQEAAVIRVRRGPGRPPAPGPAPGEGGGGRGRVRGAGGGGGGGAGGGGGGGPRGGAGGPR